MVQIPQTSGRKLLVVAVREALNLESEATSKKDKLPW